MSKVEFKHGTLINGDSYKELANIPDGSVDLTIIDPPYILPGINKKTGLGDRECYKALADMNIHEGFDFALLKQIESKMKYLNIYIFGNKTLIFDLINFYSSRKDVVMDLLVWSKTNPPPFSKNKYLADLEYILFVRAKNSSLQDGVPYQQRLKTYTSPTNTKDKKLYKHPTIKPLDLLKKFIINSSKEGDTVLDTFGGVASVAVAAREEKRKYISIEIDKKYFDIGVKRVETVDKRK